MCINHNDDQGVYCDFTVTNRFDVLTIEDNVAQHVKVLYEEVPRHFDIKNDREKVQAYKRVATNGNIETIKKVSKPYTRKQLKEISSQMVGKNRCRNRCKKF